MKCNISFQWNLVQVSTQTSELLSAVKFGDELLPSNLKSSNYQLCSESYELYLLPQSKQPFRLPLSLALKQNNQCAGSNLGSGSRCRLCDFKCLRD